jgi:hypothetical protein
VSYRCSLLALLHHDCCLCVLALRIKLLYIKRRSEWSMNQFSPLLPRRPWWYFFNTKTMPFWQVKRNSLETISLCISPPPLSLSLSPCAVEEKTLFCSQLLLTNRFFPFSNLRIITHVCLKTLFNPISCLFCVLFFFAFLLKYIYFSHSLFLLDLWAS